MDTKVTVSLGERGADRARLEVLHRQVREELHQVDDLDVASLASPTGSTHAPDGTRGLGPAEISALSVAILGSGGLTALLGSLREWLRRGHATPRTVRLEIDGDVIVLEDADEAERSELLRTFLGRHGVEEPA
jgi:Effector Associated Constant Component 1